MKNISPLHSRMLLSKSCLVLKSEGAASETISKPFPLASRSSLGSKSARYAFRVQQILSLTAKMSFLSWSLYWEMITCHQNLETARFVLFSDAHHSELTGNNAHTSLHHSHAPKVKTSRCPVTCLQYAHPLATSNPCDMAQFNSLELQMLV